MTLSPRRERLLLVAAVAALTLVGALYSFSGVNTRDEAWFLQVVARVADGDVLYGDVFFGSTPLSVWLALRVRSSRYLPADTKSPRWAAALKPRSVPTGD